MHEKFTFHFSRNKEIQYYCNSEVFGIGLQYIHEQLATKLYIWEIFAKFYAWEIYFSFSSNKVIQYSCNSEEFGIGQSCMITTFLEWPI